MKTIYILSGIPEFYKGIIKEAEKFKTSISVLGYGELNDSSKQNCNFQQPDFILTENLTVSEAKELVTLCSQSAIVMVSNDMNRANSTVNSLQNSGIYTVSAVDLANTNPNSLLTLIDMFDPNATEDNNNSKPTETDVFDDAFDSNNEISEADIETQNISEELKTEGNLNGAASVNEEIKVPEINQNQVVPQLNNQNNTFNLNINNIRTKMISVYSKKGGTGKTNIAKELANIYSSVKLPKKMQNGNSYLKTCVVDLDFERSSLRTYLGIANPNPNIYIWIADILDRIENKTSIDVISFNQFQTMSYLTKIDNANGTYFALIAGQGGLPARTLHRLMCLDDDGQLLTKIIGIILKSLKKTFDVIVMDCEATYNAITNEALKRSDNIIYVLNPTVADVENLKVFVDEVSSLKEVNLNNMGLVLNKTNKKVTLNATFLDLLSLIKYNDIDFETGESVEKNFTLISDLPEDVAVTNCNNEYTFVTNGSSPELKRGILRICEYCMPIFKVKYATNGIKELERLNKMKHKKDNVNKKRLVKEASKKAQLEKNKLKKNKKVASSNVPKDSNIEELDPNLNNPNVEVTSETNTTENMPKRPNVEGLKELLASNLKNISYDDFIAKLKELNCKETKTGFPVLQRKPKNINRKVWSLYNKNLNKELKASLKMKRNE